MARPLDPKMLSILEKANATAQNTCPPVPLLPFPRDTAPQPTLSRHFSSGKSLQDVFAFKKPQRKDKSPRLVNDLPNPGSSLRDAYLTQPSQRSEEHVLDGFDRAVLHSTELDGQIGNTSRPRISLTPRRLGGYNALRLEVDDAFSSFRKNGAPGPFSSIQFSPIRQIQPQHPEDIPDARVLDQHAQNTSMYSNQSRPRQVHGKSQQVTPPLRLENIYTPPAQRSQTPLGFSSPTSRIVSRRKRIKQSQRSYAHDEDLEQDGWKESETSSFKSRAALALAHAPPTVNGIQLVSPRELPDRFRQIFPYQLFNAVQSKVFPTVYKSNDNVVVSSPTGSGKTAILELAVVRLIETYETGQFKIVYQAPTKSLCSERARDWQQKFQVLNLQCAELTGDTDAAEMRRVGDATIIVTTPEKWDSITRKWKDYIKLLQMVKLFLIDEVHILKDSRGATLEAVVSRMKSIGANVRFVALSATVPNSHDIAVWLGKDHTNQHLPAHRETFGEEYRPVKLQKHVHGFESNINDFAFDSFLDGKVTALISKYTHKKPMMIFCFTRKSCENTAAKLAEWWGSCKLSDRAWSPPTLKVIVGNKDLQDLVTRGIAYHHAGLDPEDRHAIETGFLKGQINVICCTSTLAVGVNLPCHLVVIKGTVGYQDGCLGEYSDLEVIQMLGRAGRPQFDNSAVAIIMTRNASVDRYKKMISGQDVLESTLHLNLIEHLNSEIGLGTVHDVHSAKQWLAGTFLSVRMKQNPSYYKFSCDTGSRDPDERLEQVCERDIKALQDARLIISDQRFTCTPYGEAMSKYMVKFETMKLLLSIPEHAKLGQILHVVSQAEEFKDLRMKPTERATFRDFNKSPFIKSPIKQNISTTAHKISLIVQVQLGGVDLPTDKSFNRRQYLAEQSMVFDRINRLVRCVVDCKEADCDAVATQNALELARSISAEYWEHMPAQLRQVPQIGVAAMRKLVQSQINKVEKLATIDSATIERILSRNPPFGQKMLDVLKDFPRLKMKAEIIDKILKTGQNPRVKIKASLAYANPKLPFWRRQTSSLTFVGSVSSGKLAHVWRGSIKKLEKGFDVTFIVELLCPNDAVSCFLACDDIVGTVQTAILTPDIPASAFQPVKAPVAANSKLPKEDEEDEEDEDEDFKWDDFEDQELLAVVKNAEDSKKTYDDDTWLDRFIDIDDLDIPPMDSKAPKKSTENYEISEPVQMANGRWMCNHTCRDGQTLKSGQACKHKCCHEGLAKPPKVVRKKFSTDVSQDAKKSNEGSGARPFQSNAKSKEPRFRLKSSPNEAIDLREVEVIDLANVLSPAKYEDIATTDFRKLHALHSKVQKTDSTKSLKKAAPAASFVKNSDPYIPFLHGRESGWGYQDGGDYSSDDLPSPSKLMGHENDFGEGPSTDLDVDMPDADDVATMDEEFSMDMDMGVGMCAGNGYSSLSSPPEVSKSFQNAVFDFAAYSSANASSSPSATQTLDTQKNNLKRPAGICADISFPVMKRVKGLKERGREGICEEMDGDVGLMVRAEGEMAGEEEEGLEMADKENVKAGKEEEQKEKQQPEWLKEFDPELVAMLEGFVDFVDQ